MTHSLQFREQDHNGKPIHEYTVAGIRVPSVTEVLDKRGFCNYQDCPEDHMEAARERGQIGHEVTHWFDEAYPNFEDIGTVRGFEIGYLDAPLHPWSREILSAWINFRMDFEFNPSLIEKRMAWKINGMMVCGTPDRFGTSKLGNMVVDLKFTSKIERSVQYQLAAYSANQELWTRGKRPLRYAVHFKDGKAIPVPLARDKKDEGIFSCALSITHDLWNGGGK